MADRKIFISRISLTDAMYQAQMAGYVPDGQTFRDGMFMVFGERKYLPQRTNTQNDFRLRF